MAHRLQAGWRVCCLRTLRATLGIVGSILGNESHALNVRCNLLNESDNAASSRAWTIHGASGGSGVQYLDRLCNLLVHCTCCTSALLNFIPFFKSWANVALGRCEVVSQYLTEAQ